ncbi:lysine 2,3-aminomutase, partial [bacterium F11]
MKLSRHQQRVAQKIEDGLNESNWRDWNWQVNHAIRDIDTVEKLLGIKFDTQKRSELTKTVGKFPLSITPYYLSLIDITDIENDPILKQSFPHPAELQHELSDMADPLDEDSDSPAPGITHRYPDRALFLVSNVCAMYCRHCTRKRKVGDTDFIPDRTLIEKGLNYLRQTHSIRDVILSGGDPFLLSDDYIDWILTELRKIKHIEIIRIGTRTPVVLPYRITDNLVSILKKHHPLWLKTHFNHPRELTRSAKAALAQLSDAGIPLGNQTVLLAGVNDCPRIMKALVHQLVKNRVHPYYIYQCDLAEGLSHFRTPISKGIEIMESLIGHTSGIAVPTYVVDAPGGAGKIPLTPNYILSWSPHKVVLRNYEGIITTYHEPHDYNDDFCQKHCKNGDENSKLTAADELKAIGIEKLLKETDETISLIPANNEDTSAAEKRRTNITSSPDSVEKLRHSLIQFGPHNDRIYLMSLDAKDMPALLADLDTLAKKEKYSKIFAKVPLRFKLPFLHKGYVE